MSKAAQLGNIDVRFEKVKIVENIKRSFLCFLTIRPTSSLNDISECHQYQNMVHGITLELSTEKLAYVTLRHAEIMSCDLYQLTYKSILSTQNQGEGSST